MAYHVYVLRCRDGSLYTGITNDLERRLRAHEAGRGSKYVRTRRPFRLVYSEEAEDRSSALKAEIRIKGMARQEKLRMIRESVQGIR